MSAVARRGALTAARSAVMPWRWAGALARPMSWQGSAWIVVALAILGLLSRAFTTNSLAGEPTSDEYYYGLNALDLARGWAYGGSVSLGTLQADERSIVLETAALSFLVPWDVVTLGRTVQALFNALCIPMTFILGRTIGLPRGASAAGALLLMAAPEFQESSWRFWSDSQATFLGLVYLAALVAFARRPTVWLGLGAILMLALLYVTKDSAAVTLAPLLLVALAAASRHWLGRWRGTTVALATGVAVLALAGGLLVVGEPLLERLSSQGPLTRVAQVAQRILPVVPDLSHRLPEYIQGLVGLFSPFNLSIGFLWAWALGTVWLLVQLVRSLLELRSAPGFALGCLAAALVWVPFAYFPWRALGSLNAPDPWVALGAAGLLTATSAIGLHLGNARRRVWGLCFIGLAAVALAVERFVLWAAPDLPVAFTARSFMPAVPIFALMAGVGVWGAAAGIRLLLPSVRSSHAVATVAATLVLIGIWSPLLRERTATASQFGRRADRGADPETPQGLRVEALVAAQPWLRANLRPGDHIATTIPRHLAWYADLGVEGLNNLVNLGAHATTEAQKGDLIMSMVGHTGADYVVDFNVNWTDPNSDQARDWQATYARLARRPNLETVYLQRDTFGRPVFYVVRNHGFASSYSYTDREAARAAR